MDFMMRALMGMVFAGLVAFVTLVLPVIVFLRTQRLKLELDELRRDLSRAVDDLDRVRSMMAALRSDHPVAPMSPPRTAPPPTPAVPVPPPASAPTVSAPTVVADEPFVEPAVAVRAYASADRPSDGASSASPLGAVALAGASPAPTPARPIAPEDAADTLETRIGGRGLLFVGMATLLLGFAFFIKFAFDNEWINETARVVLGGLIGGVMVAGGLTIARRGFRLYGEIVAGGGFVSMYFATYAAFNFYGLVPQPAAFVLMVAITAGAALVADRERSQGLAFVGVLGGFATPFLVGRDENAQLVLLSYDAILVAGAMVLAERRSWPWINLASYALTLMTFGAWASRYYTPDAYVMTQVFLVVFCAMFTYLLYATSRIGTEAAGIAGAVLWSAPIAFHVASLNNLLAHSLPLLVYLVLMTLVGVIASVRFDRAWIRLAVFGATTPVFLQWASQHQIPGWRLGSVVVLLALYAMHLTSQGERIGRKGNESWPGADLVLFRANGLALFLGGYVIVNAVAPAMASSLALGLALWHFGLARYFGALSGDAGPNSMALGFALVGFAIGLEFDDMTSVVGWCAESVAVVWVGLRSRRDWMRLGGVLLLAGTTVRLMSLGFFTATAGFTPVFNARCGVTLVVVAACYAMAYIHKREGEYLDDRAVPEIGMLIVAANVLTVVLLSTEIGFYWHARAAEDASADLARMASLSVAWALYGTALIIIGINRRYAPVRYLAIVLLAITVGKVFLMDLSVLGGIYRIIGFIGLGLALLLGAWLYQRYRGLILGSDG
ncbi:MAG: DUF2339 domain-containing protein [Acidobacteriota bacterium]